mmetsp:Transcript_103541/g.329260  ORF Transcript_103541/g.329260 Transcript_103541/m.329260 type:complete len:283 (-) Transcript_103541:558-1406(-)
MPSRRVTYDGPLCLDSAGRLLDAWSLPKRACSSRSRRTRRLSNSLTEMPPSQRPWQRDLKASTFTISTLSVPLDLWTPMVTMGMLGAGGGRPPSRPPAELRRKAASRSATFDRGSQPARLGGPSSACRVRRSPRSSRDSSSSSRRRRAGEKRCSSRAPRVRSSIRSATSAVPLLKSAAWVSQSVASPAHGTRKGSVLLSPAQPLQRSAISSRCCDLSTATSSVCADRNSEMADSHSASASSASPSRGQPCLTSSRQRSASLRRRWSSSLAASSWLRRTWASM